ncbi:hypothetical protein FQA39_LY05426 [Lamprigera yunnana]|nr:hypothetical protein FQA39_LY05426 [Lamprigera yunnana]
MCEMSIFCSQFLKLIITDDYKRMLAFINILSGQYVYDGEVGSEMGFLQLWTCFARLDITKTSFACIRVCDDKMAPPTHNQTNSDNHNSKVETSLDQNPNVTFSIEFLCKLITNEFTGNRLELKQFLANCNNTNHLASRSQKTPLLFYILAKISGRAKEQLARKSFSSWEKLEEKLKALYQDRKHYSQLLEELNSCKQFYNESISDFFQLLEIINSRALSAVHQDTTDQNISSGKIASINEITLNRFIFHSNAQISQMLRWKNFENLNSAYTAALSKEKALNIQKYSKPKFCKICGRNNHDTSHCRAKSNQNQRRSVNLVNNQTEPTDNKTRLYEYQKFKFNNSNPNSNFRSKICRYCKRQEHLIEECRKRQCNNSQ